MADKKITELITVASADITGSDRYRKVEVK